MQRRQHLLHLNFEKLLQRQWTLKRHEQQQQQQNQQQQKRHELQQQQQQQKRRRLLQIEQLLRQRRQQLESHRMPGHAPGRAPFSAHTADKLQLAHEQRARSVGHRLGPLGPREWKADAPHAEAAREGMVRGWGVPKAPPSLPQKSGQRDHVELARATEDSRMRAMWVPTRPLSAPPSQQLQGLPDKRQADTRLQMALMKVCRHPASPHSSRGTSIRVRLLTLAHACSSLLIVVVS